MGPTLPLLTFLSNSTSRMKLTCCQLSENYPKPLPKWLMMNLLSCIFFLTAISHQTQAQGSFSDMGTIYQIHLGGFSGNVSLTDFNNLQDLGVLSTTSFLKKTNSGDGLTHVFLGRYLGQATANNALREVKARGYTGASLQKDAVSLNSERGSKITSAIQIELAPRPNMRKFQSLSQAYDLYLILKANGYLVVSLLHNPIERTPEFRRKVDYFINLDFDAYPIKFR
jgi:hypothetical protein